MNLFSVPHALSLGCPVGGKKFVSQKHFCHIYNLNGELQLVTTQIQLLDHFLRKNSSKVPKIESAMNN